METFLFFRSDSVEVWETFAEIGTWLVVIGVFGEGFEIAIKLAKGLKAKQLKISSWLAKSRGLEWCEKHEMTVELFGAVCWALVVGGLVIEVRGSHNAQKISGRDNAQLHLQAATANTNAAAANIVASEARERAARSEERAALVESNNLVLRSNVVELERAVQWRTITPEQEAKLIEILKPFCQAHASETNRVVVQVHQSTDFEAMRYGKRIVEVLRKCGFKIRLSTIGISMSDSEEQLPMGLEILQIGPNATPQFAVIGMAFGEAKIPFHQFARVENNPPSDVVLIRVDLKPDK